MVFGICPTENLGALLVCSGAAAEQPVAVYGRGSAEGLPTAIDLSLRAAGDIVIKVNDG